MCVDILLYSAILFTSKFSDHVIAAHRYDEIPGIFKRGNPFFGEREVKKEMLIFRETNSFLSIIKLKSHKE